MGRVQLSHLRSIFEKANLKVHTYTSPHLISDLTKELESIQN